MSVKITISGTTGSGKSTIAIAIDNLLESAGFDVDFQDEELTTSWLIGQPERMDALADRHTKIQIVTEQTHREKK